MICEIQFKVSYMNVFDFPDCTYKCFHGYCIGGNTGMPTANKGKWLIFFDVKNIDIVFTLSFSLCRT